MLKKAFLSIHLIFPLLLTQCLPTFGENENPLMNVENYVIYYGNINQTNIDQLTEYDMVVIEPHETTKETVAHMKEKGTLTIGYISIMELQTWDEEFVAKVEESDYLRVDGEKVYVKDWDTYLMDITNKHYQQLLLDEIEEEIIQKGFDGIILDTVGDIDDFYNKKEEIANPLREGYVELLKSINSQYEDLALLQNWGFTTLEKYSKDYVDGIMWENFNRKILVDSDWGQKWITDFQTMKKEENLAVFTVTPDKKSTKYSKKQDFVPYQHENSIYN